jgi:ABC-type glycerol-3-phosphate transport system permease component
VVIVGLVSSEAEIYQRGYTLWPQQFSLEAYKTAFNYPVKVFRAYGSRFPARRWHAFCPCCAAMCGYAPTGI